ncbi:MAG TPA: ATP-binding cassette domain-containing protein, partial [Gaiellaceae bacterium]|nr:ATP-binding cassette domain-containing protein [Gaiellaceae bacterium]
RSLPDGWNTLVGEEGRELSGGQRQRLVVARALLADAPVLVLDEPTAHLDAPTAERLVDDVLDAAADRAVLLITHRPEGLDRMDEIVALPTG